MISRPLSKKLKAYSLTASTILIAQEWTEGQIIYHNFVPNLSVWEYTSPVYLDLNGDSISDLKFIGQTFYDWTGSYWDPSYTHIGWASMSALNDAAIAVTPFGEELKKLNAGQIINESLSWCECKEFMAYNYVAENPSHHSFYSGYWHDEEDRFFGFRLKVGNDKYYGWMRISVVWAGFHIHDYAFNSVPNQSIIAGEDGCDWFEAALVSIPGDTVCTGDTVTLKASPAAGNKFTWVEGGEIYGSWHDSLEYVYWGNMDIQVIVTEMVSGCPDTTEIHHVAHVTLSVPSIYLENDTLFCNQSNVYGWYLNQDQIPGAQDNFLIPLGAGTYTVATNKGDCIKESSGFNYFPTSQSQIVTTDTLPRVTQQLNSILIELNNEQSTLTQFLISDIMGRKRFETNSNENRLIISTSDMESGQYFLVIQNKDRRTVFRFFKN